MPYHEPSFLNGFACGLSATAGRLTGSLAKSLITGTRRLLGRYPQNQCELYVSRVRISTRYPVTLLYEWGPSGSAEPERMFRRIPASTEEQSFFHVLRFPEPLLARNFDYNLYIFERDEKTAETHWWGGFMPFPYATSSQTWTYPGSPELVDAWITQTSR